MVSYQISIPVTEVHPCKETVTLEELSHLPSPTSNRLLFPDSERVQILTRPYKCEHRRPWECHTLPQHHSSLSLPGYGDTTTQGRSRYSSDFSEENLYRKIRKYFHIKSYVLLPYTK